MRRQILSLGVATAIVLLHVSAWAQTTPAPVPAAPQAGAPPVGAPPAGTPQVAAPPAGAPAGGQSGAVTWGGRRRAPRQSPCAADLEKFCAGVERGQGAVRECLQKHESELSPACKEHVQASPTSRRGGNSYWQSVCGTEVEKFCKDVKFGQGRIHRCLMAHEAEHGSECKTAVQARGGPAR